MVKDIVKNILYTILLPIIPLFLGLVLSFFFTRLLPGDPVIAYLSATGNPTPTPAEYNAAVTLLGFDTPLYFQFLKYLVELFSGNYGISVTITPGLPITDFLALRIPVSLELAILPIILGILGGVVLGILSVKIRFRLIKILFQILIVLGISLPMFFIGIYFLYLVFQLGLPPVIGDPFLPSIILFILTLMLTTRQVRSNYLMKPEDKHILSNSLHTIFNFSILFVSVILLETIFGIHGFFELLIWAIRFSDYWTLRVCIFIIFALSIIILFLSNLVFTLSNIISEKIHSETFTKIIGRDEKIIEESARYELDSNQKFKEYTIYRLKSPLTIIGLVIVVATFIIAIFPQVLTPLTIAQTLGIYPGAWNPPSGDHPLGQTQFGRDVLALLAYGVSTSIIVCVLSVLIAIVIGIQFGYLAKVHRYVKTVVFGFMIIVFLIPSLFMIVIFQAILGHEVILTMSIMAMYTIPWVTLIISRGNFSIKSTIKKIIAYFPLFMAFNILVFEAVAFLGFSDPMIVQLGRDISNGRMMLYAAPWASLYPGLALYLMVMGFIALHYGLKEPIPIAGRL
jgi:peptide/nickel transport system permease protein